MHRPGLTVRLISIALAVGLSALLSSARADESPDQTDLKDRIDKIAAEALEKSHVPALSIAVSKDGETILAKGYGLADFEHDVAADAQTVYRIGSITKQFTAAAIMQLVEAGKVDLDAEITAYLPDYPTHDHPVTVRHLLHHTSGIPSYTGLPSFPQKRRMDLSHDDLLAEFQDKPLEFEPGEKFKYNNSGYYLLGLIVEKASGQPYEEYLKEHVFEPLGLERSYYDRSERIMPNRARGYARDDDQLVNAQFLSMNLPYSAGALASTVGDLLAWQKALFDGKVVSPESLEQMTTPGKLNDGKPLGYGFGLSLAKRNGQEVIQHGGGITGFRSHLAHYPEFDLTVAVLTNLSSARPGRIAGRVADLFLSEDDAAAAAFDVLIRGGTLVDGTGWPSRRADVAIRGGRIVRVGAIDDATAQVEIDAAEMVVAPGFIDAHNHSERAIAEPKQRHNEGFIRQGVTTIVGGPDGSLEPSQMRRLMEAYEKNGVGTNVVFYVGHNAIRQRVMRDNPRRAASSEELERMKALVREGMELGAVGLSTGLMYEPGMFSDTDEVAALAAEVTPYGGIYDSHVRNPVHALMESDREVIEVCRRAGIGGKVGHLKAVGLQNEGLIRDVIALVEEARAAGMNIVSDQYPYDGAATSTLRRIVIVPPELRGHKAFDLKAALADRRLRDQIRQTSENGLGGGFAWLKATGYSCMRITHSEDFPDLVGQYLSRLAEKRDVAPFDLVAQLLIEAERPISITLGAIKENDVRELLVQPWNMIASDGQYVDSTSRGRGGHPRSTGTFPRVLGHYVREQKLLSLEEAIRKMTSLPADFLGLADRGRIRTGAPADVVILNPRTIRDTSEWSTPRAMPVGVRDVLVAGVPVLRDGRLTGEAPGKHLRLGR